MPAEDNSREQDLATRYAAMCDRMVEYERRRHHDRVRVVITMVHEPELDEPADSFYVQVKATGRLRRIMAEYQNRYPLFYDCFDDAPRNCLPQYGSQLEISEWALFEVTGYWGADEWRDGDVCRDHIEWMIDDFIYNLSGYHALVTWTVYDGV